MLVFPARLARAPLISADFGPTLGWCRLPVTGREKLLHCRRNNHLSLRGWAEPAKACDETAPILQLALAGGTKARLIGRQSAHFIIGGVKLPRIGKDDRVLAADRHHPGNKVQRLDGRQKRLLDDILRALKVVVNAKVIYEILAHTDNRLRGVGKFVELHRVNAGERR